jgi:Tfp pilus assembly protein PilF
MTEISPFRDAITKSTKLTGEGSYDQSFKILDDAIAEASGQNNTLWMLTLCHHAAIIAKFAGDVQRERKYYEKSLSSSPENPRALFGLAKVAKDAGDLEIARSYATRCYDAILVSDDEIMKSLTELVLKNWPDVARK